MNKTNAAAIPNIECPMCHKTIKPHSYNAEFGTTSFNYYHWCTAIFTREEFEKMELKNEVA